MPWPLLAGLLAGGGAAAGAGAAAAGTAAAGAAGVSAAGAAGTAAASGAGAAASGAAGSAASGAGGMMSKMGGMMGGGQGGGGMMSQMMSSIPMPHKTDYGLFSNTGASKGPAIQPGSNPNAYRQSEDDQVDPNRPWLKNGGALRFNTGGGIDPGFFDYLGKVTGQAQVAPTPVAPETPPVNFMQPPAAPQMTAEAPGAGMVEVQGAPTDTPAQMMGTPMPGAPLPPANPQIETEKPMPMNQTVGEANQVAPKAAAGKTLDPMSSVMGTMAANKGQYATDERGVTKTADSGEAMGDAMGKLKKGNVLGAAMGMMSHVVGNRSAMRRQVREEEQWGSQMEQAMKHSSAYNDPNSVYYAAKNGAAINPDLMHQNNNLANMMGYQHGGRISRRETIGEEMRSDGNDIPRYVEKGKSHHYYPNSKIGDMGTDNVTSPYKRTFSDVAYDVLNPNKPARIRTPFQNGGEVENKIPHESTTTGGLYNGVEPEYITQGKSYHSFPADRNSLVSSPTYKRTFGDKVYDALLPNKRARVTVKLQNGGRISLLPMMEK